MCPVTTGLRLLGETKTKKPPNIILGLAQLQCKLNSVSKKVRVLIGKEWDPESWNGVGIKEKTLIKLGH